MSHPVFAYAFENIELEIFAFKYNLKIFKKSNTFFKVPSFMFHICSGY